MARPRPARRQTPAQPQRIVSLVPALTEMLFAIGAGPQVVAVSSYDEFPPEVKQLPQVGALLDPDVERILSLTPDLVVVYGSAGRPGAAARRARRSRRSTIGTAAWRDILATMRDLGARDRARGRGRRRWRPASSARLDACGRAIAGAAAAAHAAGLRARAAGPLRDIYASGGRGFLHDMLEIAGGDNVFADVEQRIGAGVDRD